MPLGGIQRSSRQTWPLGQAGRQPGWLQKPSRQLSPAGQSEAETQLPAALEMQSSSRQTWPAAQGGAQLWSAQYPPIHVSGVGQLELEVHVTGAQRPAVQARPAGQLAGQPASAPASGLDGAVEQAPKRITMARDRRTRPHYNSFRSAQVDLSRAFKRIASNVPSRAWPVVISRAWTQRSSSSGAAPSLEDSPAARERLRSTHSAEIPALVAPRPRIKLPDQSHDQPSGTDVRRGAAAGGRGGARRRRPLPGWLCVRERLLRPGEWRHEQQQRERDQRREQQQRVVRMPVAGRRVSPARIGNRPPFL